MRMGTFYLYIHIYIYNIHILDLTLNGCFCSYFSYVSLFFLLFLIYFLLLDVTLIQTSLLEHPMKLSESAMNL